MSNKQAELLSKISVLQLENSNLRDQIQKSTSYFKDQLNRVKVQLTNYFQKQIMELKNKLLQAQQDLHAMDSGFQSSREHALYLEKQVQKMKTQVMDKLKSPEENHLATYDLLTEQMRKIKIQALTSLPQFASRYYTFQGPQVRFVGQQNQNAHFIFNQPIYPFRSGSFKFKIIVALEDGIGAGFVVYSEQKDARYSYNSPWAMCYFGNTKRTYPDDKQQGNGWKTGDIVEIVLNRDQRYVYYYANGSLVAKYMNTTFLDSQKYIFMPFVEIFTPNDTVEILI